MDSGTNDLFYEAVAAIGGRIDSDWADTGAGALMEEFQKIAEASLPGNVLFNYIQSSEINSVAFVYKGHEFIGINLGTVLCLYDLFFSLLADHSFAPDIGTSSGNAVHLPGVVERVRSAQAGAWALPHKDTVWLGAIPDNPKRLAYAYALAFCALFFILQHELAHLELGHLEYLNNRYGVNELFERRVHDGGTWACDVSLACEVDADTFAAGRCLRILRRFHARSGPPVLHPTFVDVLNDTKASFRAWSTAVWMLFFVLGLGGPGLGARCEGSHPHPYLRYMLILDRWLFALREDPALQATFQTALDESREDVIPVIDAMGALADLRTYVGTMRDLEMGWNSLITRITPELDHMVDFARIRMERLGSV